MNGGTVTRARESCCDAWKMQMRRRHGVWPRAPARPSSRSANRTCAAIRAPFPRDVGTEASLWRLPCMPGHLPVRTHQTSRSVTTYLRPITPTIGRHPRRG